MEYWDIVFGIMLAFCLSALFTLLGVVIGGLFVLRTKRDGYEPLMPPLRDKQELSALNLDDLQYNEEASEPDLDSEVEKIFEQRKQEEPDPLQKAHSSFRNQNSGLGG